VKEMSDNTNRVFPTEGGTAGGFIRNHNWATSTLGEPAAWPVSLRTLVQMMLNTEVPTLLFWGPDLVTFFNDSFLNITNSDIISIRSLGCSAADIWSESWNTIGPVFDSVLSGEGSVGLQNQNLSLHGTSPDWTYAVSALSSDDGSTIGLMAVGQQVAGPLDSARRLQISEQRFQNLVREASMGIIMLSGPQMHVEIVNEAYASLIGRKTSELIGNNLFAVIPEAAEPFSSLIQSVLKSNETLQLYAQPYFVFVDGGKKEGFLDLVYQPYKELDGKITGVIILCQDVTRQVHARQRLEESETRLRSLVDSAPFPIGVYVGPEMKIQLVNQSIIDVWGKGPDVVGKRYDQVLPELANTGIYGQLEQVYNTGRPYYANNQRVDLTIGGELQRFYFKYTFTPLFDNTGNVYGVMNTAADVTDLVIAQEQLEQAQVSLKVAVELAQLGSWELDLQTGRITYSDILRSWFGFDKGPISLEDVYEPIHPDDREMVRKAIEAALEPDSPGVYQAEYRLVPRLDVHGRILHAIGKVIFDADGRPYKLLGTAQDVTAEREREQTLEQLVQQRTAELAVMNEEFASMNEELSAQNEEYFAVNEELEEANQLLSRSNENLQQFAYVASHDLQEPLRKIQQFSDILKSKNEIGIGKEIHYLDRIQSAAGRMSVLIRDLLDFSRIQTEYDTDGPVPLHQVVRSVLMDLDLVVSETEAKIKVGDLPVLHGNRGQLGQLFQNIISNALKFRKPDLAPEINISGSPILYTELPPDVKPTRATKIYHLIQVDDNGIGFDTKHLDRIFQVFQRLHSKHEIEGTGIGLAICEKVVSNHGGAITATSKPGQGASFKIYFPAY
jgi:PAS domain S-box-containing protein